MKKGDKVYLVNTRYFPTRTHPVKGSRYSCEGKVLERIKFPSGKVKLFVEWDNGKRIMTYEKNFELVNESTYSKAKKKLKI